MVNDVWVEVDLEALRHNLRQVREVVGPRVRVMAVVKANGYGHGLVEPSRALVDAGADALAVTRIEEAVPIRNAGITAPILLLTPIQPDNAEAAIGADLEMTVCEPALARAVSEAATKLGRTARIHAKVDTGMGRLGLPPDEVPSFFQTVRELKGVEVAGIYTHFASAAEADVAAARDQLDLFRRVIEALQQMGFAYGLAHASNSAGILGLAGSHLDMVRPGTLLYGQYPSHYVPRALDLKPTWKLKARICQVKDLPAGAPVGYGGEFAARRHTRAAVIPVGYADGFTLAPVGPIYRQSVIRFIARKMRQSLSVVVRGQRAPVIGRVAMQMTIIDVTHVSGATVGDEVTIPALRIPTSALIPRVYVDPLA